MDFDLCCHIVIHVALWQHYYMAAQMSSNPYKYMDYYLFTDAGGMEG